MADTNLPIARAVPQNAQCSLFTISEMVNCREIPTTWVTLTHIITLEPDMLNVYFLKAVGFNHPLLFSGHRTSQELLCFCRGMWRPTTISTSTFLFPLRTFIFTSEPREWRWLGRRSAAPRRKPQGQHGDVPGQQHRQGVQQRRGWKCGLFAPARLSAV